MPNWFFDKTCIKRSEIEKVSINVRFCIFKLGYSWVPIRRGAEINRGGGRGQLEDWKLNRWGEVEEILSDTLK